MAAANVKRIIFREVLPGDRKKFVARSASSGTGGGARDFRYTPFDNFDGVFGRALKGRDTVIRTRNGTKVPITVYTSKVSIPQSGGKAIIEDLRFEPPTTAREGEGRLAELDKFGLQPPTNEGRVLLLIIEDASGNVILTFYSEKDLINGQWHPDIDQFFGQVFSKPQKRSAAQGYIDYDRHTQWIK